MTYQLRLQRSLGPGSCKQSRALSVRVVSQSADRRHVLQTAFSAVVGATCLPAKAAVPNEDFNLPKLPLDQFFPVTDPKGEQAPSKRLPKTPSVKIGQKGVISKIVKGCGQLDGEHSGDPATDRTTGAEALTDFGKFVDAGMTSFDTADVFGPSQSLIGQYFRLFPDIRRRVQVLSTFTCGDPEDDVKPSADRMEHLVRTSIARMHCEYIDVAQLQWDGDNAQQLVDTARYLSDLVGTGLVRGVGVTNLDTERLIRLVDEGIPIVSNQVSYSLVDRRPALYLAPYCQRKGIALLARGVMAGGFLSAAYVGLPANKARLDTRSKVDSGQLLTALGGWDWFQDVLQVMQGIATKHGVSVSAVAVRWLLDQPGVTAAVIGARNANHIKDLRTVFAYELDDVDHLDLDAVWEASTQTTADVGVWEREGTW